jgi:hypothetical protein
VRTGRQRHRWRRGSCRPVQERRISRVSRAKTQKAKGKGNREKSVRNEGEGKRELNGSQDRGKQSEDRMQGERMGVQHTSASGISTVNSSSKAITSSTNGGYAVRYCPKCYMQGSKNGDAVMLSLCCVMLSQCWFVLCKCCVMLSRGCAIVSCTEALV